MKPINGRPRTFRLLLASLIMPWVLGVGCFAQLENPVYVDDSPLAWELFQRAQDQSRDNVAEAVRLYQELLDDYGLKLIPAGPTERDRLYSVRSRVLTDLGANAELLARYQLIESAEAERLLAADDLYTLTLTRSLTQPGLQALLTLGQRELESARFRAALRHLREAQAHPSLTEPTAAHCAYMIGVASHYLGEDESLAQSRQTLSTLGRVGEPFLTELNRIAAESTYTGPLVGASPIDSNAHFAIDDLVAQEIWSKELPETLVRRRYSDAMLGTRTGFGMDRRRRGLDIVTVAPTATENAVFVNEGHTVRAFDRFTGYELWSQPFRDRLAVTINDPDTDAIGDLNVIAVEGDALVTLTGHADADGRSSSGQIVCIDARTGTKRWSMDVDHMMGEDEYEGLFPHGRPVIAEGRVFCLARKQSTQTLTATYLVALDLATGEPVWVRHMASSALIRMRHTRAFSSPLYDRGELLIATSVGAVATVDAATGEIKWLRVHRPPITEPPQQRRSWELTGPVVTSRGIIAIQPDDRRVMLLDRDTGQMIESYPIGTSDGWGAPAYLLANDRFVFAIGSSVRAFSVDHLERPLWQVPAVQLERSIVDGRDPAIPSSESDLEIAGRVQLTTGALIVPTTRGLQLLDIETGHEEQRLSLKSIVVPLAVDSQLFVAGSDYLDAYMPFGTAERILRERLARKPGEVEPALSLLRLGIRVRHLDLVLEAAELARKTLAPRPDNAATHADRDVLFAMLLEAARLNLGAESEGGERLHAALREVAITPEQQVEQLLAYGAWCSAGRGHRLTSAVEAYQAILENPLLSSTEREGAAEGMADGVAASASENRVSKAARAWAIDRLHALMNTHGEMVYAPQADFASLELARVRERNDVAALRTLADRFPFAAAAGEAAILAAKLLADGGLQREALATLVRTLSSVPVGRQPMGQRLLGEMVTLSLALGWRDYAVSLLEYAATMQPGKDVQLASGPRDPNVWLEMLGVTKPAPVRVGAQSGPAERLGGVVVDGFERWIDTPNGKIMLLLAFDELRAIRATDLREAWSCKLSAATWELLGIHDGAAVMWQRSPIQDPRAVAIELRDGKVRWSTPSLDQFDRDAVGQIRRDRAGVDLMPNGLPLNPNEVLPVLTRDKLYMVRRTGEMYAVDLRLGEPIVSVKSATIEEVHAVHATDFGMVLVGRSVPLGGRAAGSERVPAIVLLNPAKGDVLLRIEPTSVAGVVWSHLTPLGELIFGTDSGVEKVSLHNGQRIWRQRGSAAEATHDGWIGEKHVLVETGIGALRAIAMQTGAISEPFHRPRTALGGDSSQLVNVVFDRGRIFAQFVDRIVRVSEEGMVLGADAIADERDYRALLPAEDRLVLVSKVGTTQERDALNAPARTKHIYRIYGLSQNGALMEDGSELEPLDESIRREVLVDGLLLLSTGTTTYAVPMPVRAK